MKMNEKNNIYRGKRLAELHAWNTDFQANIIKNEKLVTNDTTSTNEDKSKMAYSLRW